MIDLYNATTNRLALILIIDGVGDVVFLDLS
jgi:hypothetical protein